jgi:V-type H+-transporting ATPase proteolipid subunit
MGNSTHTDVPLYTPFFGMMGITVSQVFASMGSAYGIAQSAIGIANMSVLRPELVMKSLIPGKFLRILLLLFIYYYILVIMAGIISIYGLVVSIILASRITISIDGYKTERCFSHLAAGMTCGLCGLAAGYAIGIVGDRGVRAHALQPRLFVGMVLVLIFAEVSSFLIGDYFVNFLFRC